MIQFHYKKKVDFLQDENNILKKNCVELSQNLSKINNADVNNITDLEKELEYKNNVIKYLEQLLKNSGINANNYNYMLNYNKNKNTGLNENNIKLSKTQNDLDFNNIKNEESNRQYFTFYNINQKSINASKNSEIKNSQEVFSPKIIQQEIDDIDKEIIDLQKQLKHLLNE